MTGDLSLLLSVLGAAACGALIGRHAPRSTTDDPLRQPFSLSARRGDTLVLRVDPSQIEPDTLGGRFSNWAASKGMSVLVLPNGVSVEAVLAASSRPDADHSSHRPYDGEHQHGGVEGVGSEPLAHGAQDAPGPRAPVVRHQKDEVRVGVVAIDELATPPVSKLLQHPSEHSHPSVGASYGHDTEGRV